VAALLWLIKGYVSTPPPVDVELLLTVCEEDGLVGASKFDLSKLAAKRGYLFDSAGPVGNAVVASPTYYRLSFEVQGVSAHAGVEPEKGRSAVLAVVDAVSSLEWGRIDSETTTNVGRVEGGSYSTNVVPAACTVELEVRSLNSEAAASQVSKVVDAFNQAVSDRECSFEVDVRKLFNGYKHGDGSAAFQTALTALKSCCYRAEALVSGGGSDANALIAKGFDCVNLSNGTESNHRPDEHVSSDALHQIVKVAKEIVKTEASCVIA